jgi:hypothetical protein
MERGTPSLFWRGTHPGRSASQPGPVGNLLGPGARYPGLITTGTSAEDSSVLNCQVPTLNPFTPPPSDRARQ